jgi:hypothetical protein
LHKIRFIDNCHDAILRRKVLFPKGNARLSPAHVLIEIIQRMPPPKLACRPRYLEKGDASARYIVIMLTTSHHVAVIRSIPFLAHIQKDSNVSSTRSWSW